MLKLVCGVIICATMFFGAQLVVACGGMTTVDPPSLTLEDPVEAPPVDTNTDEWGEGEAIL